MLMLTCLLLSMSMSQDVSKRPRTKRTASTQPPSLSTTASAAAVASTSAQIPEEEVRLCRVCGDVASGYNFSGLSCEPCKAFFRRNARREQDLQCTNVTGGGRTLTACPINKATRKQCSRCRLRRCLQIGMRKELIWICDPTGSINDDSDDTRDSPQISFLTKKVPSKDLIYSTALKPYEMSLLDQVQRAAVVFDDLNEFQLELSPIETVSTLIDALIVPDAYSRRLIRFYKALEPFACLSLAQQLRIMKRSVATVALIRAACLYCAERDGIIMIKSETEENRAVLISLKLLQEPRPEMAKQFRAFFYCLKKEMTNDPNVRHLLMAQYMFFSTSGQMGGDNDDEYARAQYVRYRHLLRRYLEDRYSSISKAGRKCQQLTLALAPLESGEIHRSIRTLLAACDDASRLPQIYSELFDTM